MDANAMTLQLYSTTLEELQILCAAKLLMKEGKMSAEQAPEQGPHPAWADHGGSRHDGLQPGRKV